MHDTNKFAQSLKHNRAFTAKLLFDLHLLITEQAADVYRDMGIIFPVSVSSTVLYLNSVEQASLTQIAKALSQPHQLISQRIKTLLKLDLLVKSSDKVDKRRTFYSLSSVGKQQGKLLKEYCYGAEVAFNNISEEIGVDLHELLNQSIDSLHKNSFSNRWKRTEND